jgi:hypothetical protein
MLVQRSIGRYITPRFHHSNIPVLQYSNTPSLQEPSLIRIRPRVQEA